MVPSPPPEPASAAEPPRASLRQVVGAVFWSFLGVRRRADYESDTHSLKPQHVIAAGLASAAVFVLALYLLVQFLTR